MTTRQEAEKYLVKFIPKKPSGKFPASHGLKRASLLLSLLNNPQEKMQIIHVAGTSGKGTTSYITSLLLRSHGNNVGLHLSPHLLDIRERMMINNRFISDTKFVNYLKVVLKAVDKCTQILDSPSYFEILTALAFYAFAEEGVDIAVIETGMGGTFDATNTVKRKDKVCVITKIGKDHTNILGKTLPQIASQKAGIIHQNNKVYVLSSKYTDRVFAKKAEQESADITFISNQNFKKIQLTKESTVFDYTFKNTTFKNLSLSLLGHHQVENTALALASASSVISLNEKKVRQALKNIRFKGRLDKIKYNNKTIIIDGAHNPQKIKTLTTTLKKIYPQKKFTTIIAIKKGKQYTKILKSLKDITKTIVTTAYFKNDQDLLHIANEALVLSKKAEELKFEKVITTDSPENAIKQAIKQPNSHILATGSLYYLSDIYKNLK